MVDEARPPPPSLLLPAPHGRGRSSSPPADDGASAPTRGSLIRETLVEVRHLSLLAYPIIASQFLSFAINLVLLVCVGTLGKERMSAIVLAMSFYGVSGVAVVVGFASVVETTCGQAFGAGAFAEVGTALQRGILTCGIAVVAVWVSWIPSERVFLLLGQEPEIARDAAAYLRIVQLALPMHCLSGLCGRYLNAQGASRWSAAGPVAAAVAGPVLIRYGVRAAGADGAAWALVVTFAVNASATVASVCLRERWLTSREREEGAGPGGQPKEGGAGPAGSAAAPRAWGEPSGPAGEGGVVEGRPGAAEGSRVEGRPGSAAASTARAHPPKCWRGWSRSALRGWWTYVTLGIPALLEVLAEWLAFELCTVASGWLPQTEASLSATGIVQNLVTIFYMLPLGVALAAGVRTGNALGGGRARDARTTVAVGSLSALLLQVALGCVVALLRHPIAGSFSSDLEVRSLVARALAVAAVGVPLDGFNCAAGACLRGAGRQVYNLGLFIASYWAVGIPTAALFGFHLGWGVPGIYVGLVTASAVLAVGNLVILLRINWDLEASRARSSLENVAAAAGGGFEEPLLEPLLEPLDAEAGTGGREDSLGGGEG